MIVGIISMFKRLIKYDSLNIEIITSVLIHNENDNDVIANIFTSVFFFHHASYDYKAQE